MQTITFLETERNNFINSLIENKQNFILRQTNYSDEIIFNEIRYIINNAGFNDFEVIKYRNKIISDIKEFETKNRAPRTVDKKTINYFDLGNYLIKGGANELNDLFCIDIKSAYPTTFFNKKYISEKTFNELGEAKKEIRLKACGSVATEKIIYEFKDGVCFNAELKESERGNYFFDVVKTVSQSMGQIKQLLNKDFLFFWVDGIFFNGEGNIKAVTQLLEMHGYKYKIEFVNKMKITKEKKHLFIDLIKEGKNKVFNLPLINKKRINFVNQ